MLNMTCSLSSYARDFQARFHVRPRKNTTLKCGAFGLANLVLSGLHTANLSRQTRVGKLKLVCVNGIKTVGKHVLFGANSLQKCLPPVFVLFTHTSLGLPTLVCQLKFAV